MIRFQCGHCGKKLGIADSEAGLVVTCPYCEERTRIPGQPRSGIKGRAAPAPKRPTAKGPAKPPRKRPAEEEEEVFEDVEIVEEEPVEVEPMEEEPPPRRHHVKAAPKHRPPARREDFDLEEERPRKGKKKRRRDEDEDDEDFPEEGGKGLTPNRFRGIVATSLAVIVLLFGLFFGQIRPDVEQKSLVTIGMCSLAGLMFIAGIYYLVRG